MFMSPFFNEFEYVSSLSLTGTNCATPPIMKHCSIEKESSDQKHDHTQSDVAIQSHVYESLVHVNTFPRRNYKHVSLIKGRFIRQHLTRMDSESLRASLMQSPAPKLVEIAKHRLRYRAKKFNQRPSWLKSRSTD